MHPINMFCFKAKAFLRLAAWCMLLVSSGYSQTGAFSDSVMTLAGRWAHGVGSAIAVQDSRVYYNDGGFLIIADTDSAGAISNRRFYQRPGMIKGIAVRDSLLYSVNGKAGFQILNISDPDHPIDVASLPIGGDAFRLQLQGDYAFVGSDMNQYAVHIIDISIPDNPAEISVWQSGQYTSAFADLAVGNQHFYCVNGGYQYNIVDFSDPVNPVQVGTIATSRIALNTAIANGYLYIAQFRYRMLIYDLSNPAAPALVSEFDMGTPISTDLEIQDSLMVLSRINSGVALIDLSDPVNPQLLLDLFKPSENIASVQSALNGDRLYLAGVNDTWSINIADPAAPAAINSFPTGGTANAAMVTGDQMYVSSSLAGFKIVDVSNPAQPVGVGEFSDGGAWYRDIFVRDSIAYTVADVGLSGKFSTYDVSDPANIIPLGASTISGGVLLNIRLKMDHAFIADRVSGVRIYDVSNPAAPQSTAIISGIEAYRLAISGDVLYVASLGAGLKIYDISNPAQPAPLGAYNTAGTALGVAISGNTAFIADKEGGLRIIDVTDPAAPAEIAFLDAGNDVLSVEVQGDYVYLGTADGLLVADVSNPTLPQPLEWFSEFDEFPYNIYIRDETMYIAGGGDGVYILRNNLLTSIASNPATRPVGFHLAQNYPNPFNPETVISYQLSVVNDVTVTVYDLLGRKVRTLADRRQSAGQYSVAWDGRDDAGKPVAGGVYFFQLQAGELRAVRKGILVK